MTLLADVFAQTGVNMHEIPSAHDETVSAIEWLPDNSGFISGGLDRKIKIWVSNGTAGYYTWLIYNPFQGHFWEGRKTLVQDDYENH